MKKTRRGAGGETAERKEQDRTRNKREKAQRGTESAHQRQAERGINERGGERRQGKATLTYTHRERVRETWVKLDVGKEARSSRMRASWTATHLLYRPQRCSLITL